MNTYNDYGKMPQFPKEIDPFEFGKEEEEKKPKRKKYLGNGVFKQRKTKKITQPHK